MRTLQSPFPPDALSTLDTVLKHTKDVRVFRRAQAVREVVKGRRIKAVSQAFAFTYKSKPRVASSSGSTQMKRAWGALPCRGRPGGALPTAHAGPPVS
jgi:hypothetical protein